MNRMETLRLAMSTITGGLTGVAIMELTKNHLTAAIAWTLAVATSVLVRCWINEDPL